MNWLKSKPYWAKGGIIGGVIAIFLSLLYFICLYFSVAEAALGCLLFLWPGILFLIPLDELIFRYGETSLAVILVNIPHFIFWVLTGALTGWIVGKIKSR